jgi:3-dehydroquinate dehydratase-1
VAVIASHADLLHAKRVAATGFFELRLDTLAPIIGQLERKIRELTVPLIVTARHPREGGAHQLNAEQRAELLLRFLNYAAYVDLELRALRELAEVRRRARAQSAPLIVSVHELRDTPPPTALRHKADRAAKAGADIFKIVTRTDTSEQVDRLFAFFDAPDVDLPISAMGFGRFGRITRLELAARGSALNYAHLGSAQVPGQFSLAAWKRVVRYLRRTPRSAMEI